MKWTCPLTFLAVVFSATLAQGTPPGLEGAERSPLSTFFIAPTRVVWQSDAGVQNADSLLKPHAGQAVLQEPQPPCRLTTRSNSPAGILLDFGRELHGYVELITPLTPEQAKLRRVRVRLGESVSEAMAELGGKQNAQNDHAIRDQVVTLPWLGKKMVGPGGFRFVRLDNPDPQWPVALSQVRAVLQRLANLISPDGKERINGMRFLDWPSSPNQQGVTAGLQGLLVMTLESGARLMTTLGVVDTAKLCTEAAARGRQVVPEVNRSKSGAALLSLAGMVDAKKVSDTVLKFGGPKDISTFYGFYVLQALAKSGDTDTALDFIRTYWGAMLDLGATTFWEDFNLEWTTNAARIDELVPPDKKDIHGDFGAYCYQGFRHSLCHGWASGPTAWLSQNVLGVKPLEPGCKRVRVAPQLGNLKWVEGAYPTPLGPIRIRHERKPDGTVASTINAPPGIQIESASRP